MFCIVFEYWFSFFTFLSLYWCWVYDLWCRDPSMKWKLLTPFLLFKVTFKNKASRPYSFHLHGVYDRSQGAGIAQTLGSSAPVGVPGEAVPPGEARVYNWRVTRKQGPTDTEFDCKAGAYYSTVDKVWAHVPFPLICFIATMFHCCLMCVHVHWPIYVQFACGVCLSVCHIFVCISDRFCLWMFCDNTQVLCPYQGQVQLYCPKGKFCLQSG